MANWLEQMFTPQRPGPGQMAWRDKDVGEGSGEISQGDIQEMYWKRNPAARGHGQQMTSAVRPNPTGSGETMQTKIQDLIPAGLESGGMSSSTPGQVDGFEDISITESVFDPMGSGANRMLGNSSFGGQGSSDMQGIGGNRSGVGDQGLSDIRDVASPSPIPDISGNRSGVGDQGHIVNRAAINNQQGVTQLQKLKNLLAPTLYKGEGISEAPLSGVMQSAVGPGQTNPATGIPDPMEAQWPEWMSQFGKFMTPTLYRGQDDGFGESRAQDYMQGPTTPRIPNKQSGGAVMNHTDPRTGVPPVIDGQWPAWLARMFN